jgi:hypothetical protein
MLTALALLSLAQATPMAPAAPVPEHLASVSAIEGPALPRIPNEIIRQNDVRSLPGALDSVPVFNSNSPELIQQNGILLSTFPRNDMAYGDAHLDYAFEGRFDFFAHHVARGVAYNDRRTLFIGGVLYNPTDRPVTVEILQGVSYLSQEAPFRNLASTRSNPDGNVYAGPGSRTVTDFLQGRSQSQWPRRIVIPPERAYLLMNAPIPLRRLPFTADATLPPGSVLPGATNTFASSPVASVTPRGSRQELPSNGRSLLLHLRSDGPVYAATLAMYAPSTLEGQERAPTLQEWLLLLVNGNLAGPRDIPPTDPEEYRKNSNEGRFFYGRVAGVAQGSQWQAITEDEPNTGKLTIPQPGEAISYVVSTVDHNTFGTEQIQSAPMLARYPDTAYRAHGNYGVHYKLRLPLYNNSDEEQQVVLRLQTPLQDETLNGGLRFLRNPANRVFFRGTVRLRYETATGQAQTRYVHVVQRQGDEGDPILRLNLPPAAQREVTVELIYPPDATPPQVLTISTSGITSAIREGAPTADSTESNATTVETQENSGERTNDAAAEGTIDSPTSGIRTDEDIEPGDSTESSRSMDEAGLEFE